MWTRRKLINFHTFVLYNMLGKYGLIPFLLVQNGAVRGRVYQPHESHVPYTLQFLMDHNLHGMNLVHLSSCKFRRPPGMGA